MVRTITAAPAARAASAAALVFCEEQEPAQPAILDCPSVTTIITLGTAAEAGRPPVAEMTRPILKRLVVAAEYNDPTVWDDMYTKSLLYRFLLCV